MNISGRQGRNSQPVPGGYFRCAYDSLIFSFRYHIELIEKLTGQSIETIHLMGGGCQSAYLTSQTTAICQRKVVSGPVEAATIGNILVQAMAMGVLPGLDEARIAGEGITSCKNIRSGSLRQYGPGLIQKIP